MAQLIRLIFVVAACVCFFGDPQWVVGGSVPANQAEGVAQIGGFIFTVGALILKRLETLLPNPTEGKT